MLVTAAAAGAWSRSAQFYVFTHGVMFWKVTTTNKGQRCELATTVHFNVPHPWLTRYRAKVTFDESRWVSSPVFQSNSAGSQRYQWRLSTQSQGCWAARPQKPRTLQVTSCYGASCQPPLL